MATEESEPQILPATDNDSPATDVVEEAEVEPAPQPQPQASLFVIGGCDDLRRHSFDCVRRSVTPWIQGKADRREEESPKGASCYEALAPMGCPRHAHAVCVATDEEIFVIGGHDGKNLLRSAEKFVISEQKWVALPNLHFQRAFLGCACVKGQHVLAIGGQGEKSVLKSVELYNPAANTWRALPPMSEPRHSCSTAVIGQRVYVFGGRDEAGNHGKVHKSCEMLELPATPGAGGVKPWRQLRPMKQARSGATAVAFKGRVFVIGGTTGVKPLQSVEIYDPKANTWQTGPPLNSARAWHSAFVWRDQIVVFGGQEPTAQYIVDTVEVLDPTPILEGVTTPSPPVMPVFPRSIAPSGASSSSALSKQQQQPPGDTCVWRVVGSTGLKDAWMYVAVPVAMPQEAEPEVEVSPPSSSAAVAVAVAAGTAASAPSRRSAPSQHNAQEQAADAGESGVISLTAQCANRQSSVVQPHQSSSAPDSVNISPSASAATNGRPDEPREMGSFSSLERPKMRTLLPMDVLAANKMQQREGRGDNGADKIVHAHLDADDEDGDQSSGRKRAQPTENDPLEWFQS
ncbi:unnamed protein product [Vitrella brassicaformis CCMP3155]|uniref:Uncharacterized protein n=1 Tax=Vitrella brassicaformis (strain CCMP3155) TaxID=1169540 RepID=A0A0G4EB21_VITBC|nr:unnamed protein product [Vitrella brassicaformis CCMP3155]|eukprot:CEL92681.1 unnamed protein product [Vitrella brassicaformis CCMP3155]